VLTVSNTSRYPRAERKRRLLESDAVNLPGYVLTRGYEAGFTIDQYVKDLESTTPIPDP
jgi:hypothetical protein